MQTLTRFIKQVLIWLAVIAGAVVLAAVLSWEWLFAAGVGLAVYHVGVAALLGRQRLSSIPARLVMSGVVLFFFFGLFRELVRWTLYGEKSQVMERVVQPVIRGFNEIFVFDAGTLCAAQQEFYWARAVVLLVFLVGLVRLFRR
jgi:hypothetical protein